MRRAAIPGIYRTRSVANWKGLRSAFRPGLPCFAGSCRWGAGEGVAWRLRSRRAEGEPARLASLRPPSACDGPSRICGDAGDGSGRAGSDSLQPHKDRCRICPVAAGDVLDDPRAGQVGCQSRNSLRSSAGNVVGLTGSAAFRGLLTNRQEHKESCQQTSRNSAPRPTLRHSVQINTSCRRESGEGIQPTRNAGQTAPHTSPDEIAIATSADDGCDRDGAHHGARISSEVMSA
jgi:hypothetical protein